MLNKTKNKYVRCISKYLHLSRYDYGFEKEVKN